MTITATCPRCPAALSMHVFAVGEVDVHFLQQTLLDLHFAAAHPLPESDQRCDCAEVCAEVLQGEPCPSIPKETP